MFDARNKKLKTKPVDTHLSQHIVQHNGLLDLYRLLPAAGSCGLSAD